MLSFLEVAALLVVLGTVLYLSLCDLARRCPKCDALTWGFRVLDSSPTMHWRCPRCQCRFYLDGTSKRSKIVPQRADARYMLEGFAFTDAGIFLASHGQGEFVPYNQIEALEISGGLSFRHPVAAALLGLGLLAVGALASAPALQIISDARLREALSSSSVYDEPIALTLGPGCILFGAWLLQASLRRTTFVRFRAAGRDHEFSLESLPRRRDRRAFLTFLESKTEVSGSPQPASPDDE